MNAEKQYFMYGNRMTDSTCQEGVRMIQRIPSLRCVLGLGLIGAFLALGGYGMDAAIAQGVVTVDCGAGQRLSDALAEAVPGTTIRISGTCTEHVTITTDRLVLDGQGHAVLDGRRAFPGQGVITIIGARGVTIIGMTVRRGSDGIQGNRGASFEVIDTLIQSHQDDGVEIDENATARIRDCIIERNRGVGIEVARSSSVVLIGELDINNNGADGLSVRGASTAFMALGSSVNSQQNGRDGIAIILGSSLELSGSAELMSARNGRFGVFLAGSSNWVVFGTVDANDNVHGGIQVTRTSSVEFGGGSIVMSREKDQDGLEVRDTSAVVAFDGADVHLKNLVVGPNSSCVGLGSACPAPPPSTTFSAANPQERRPKKPQVHMTLPAD